MIQEFQKILYLLKNKFMNLKTKTTIDLFKLEQEIKEAGIPIFFRNPKVSHISKEELEYIINHSITTGGPTSNFISLKDKNEDK